MRRQQAARVALGTALEHPCPECGGVMVLRDSRFGLFYGCRAYPRCKATHGAHRDTGLPLGIPADRETKIERQTTHALFDRLWQGDGASMRRHEAYAWMAARMGLEKDEAHIGRFGAGECQRMRALVAEHFPELVEAVP